MIEALTESEMSEFLTIATGLSQRMNECGTAGEWFSLI